MRRFALALSALTLLVAGCSAQDASSNEPTVFSPQRSTPAPKPPGRVGDTLNLDRIGGGKIAVTLTAVIDPATVPSGRGNPDKNYLATALTITNTGRLTITGDANNNVSLIGSDDHDYPADLANVTECTNFVQGQFVLAPAVSATGCVVFALPSGVTPARVKYSPSSGISLDIGEWLVS